MFHAPEQYRVCRGPLASDAGYGNNGAFELPAIITSRKLFIIASDGSGWEHVSVHVVDGKRDRTPVWEEMCHVKGVFWDDEDAVVQYHPRKQDYVNFHSHTLHLWRPTEAALPLPTPILIGPKTETPYR